MTRALGTGRDSRKNASGPDDGKRRTVTSSGTAGSGASQGLVIVHTGDGKGKSTAALGMVIRAIGNGMRAIVLQFFKGARPTGELILNDLVVEGARAQVEIVQLGEGFTWEVGPQRSLYLAQEAWKRCQQAIASGAYDLVVCDEINIALSKGFLSVAAVVQALGERPPHVHVVLTGRSAPEALMAAADLVTEMRLVKHPHGLGVPAQPGIEF